MKFRLGIRSKLVGIINAILVLASGAIVWFATSLFSQENIRLIQDGNKDSAFLRAEQIGRDLTGFTEKMRHISAPLLQAIPAEQLAALHRPFFEQDTDLFSQTVFKRVSGAKVEVFATAVNDGLLKTADVSREDLNNIQSQIPTERLLSGSEFIVSGQLKGSIPVVTIGIPLVTDASGNVTHTAVATLKQDRLLKSVVGDNSIITSYLVDSEGFVLAHSDQEKVLKKTNLSHLDIVKKLLSGKSNNGQTRFVDPETQITYLGAFKTVGFGGVGVVSQVEERIVLQPSIKVRYTSLLITGIIGAIAFLFVFFYSMSMTGPLLRLVEATLEIVKGNYEVKLRDVANDEIGDLTHSFNEMAGGLAEREKIKNAFSKFHSKDIADKILSGDLNLTGERKKVTVFFSDIRSFTSISEKLQPEQVVELVNSYMTAMVRIIFAHGGVVDKYVGDAIMAVYGTPMSYGDDSIRAVSAALRMRAELKRYNMQRAAQGKPTIAIGMGMHTGDVVAGNIGSPERMEYTILGDNVNLTSRMESLTKEYSTDILISGDTYKEVKDWIHCECRGSTKVKGKAEEVQVWEVMGFLEGREYIPPETGSTGESVDVDPTLIPPTFGAPSGDQPPPLSPELTRSLLIDTGASVAQPLEIGAPETDGLTGPIEVMDLTGEVLLPESSDESDKPAA